MRVSQGVEDDIGDEPDSDREHEGRRHDDTESYELRSHLTGSFQRARELS